MQPSNIYAAWERQIDPNGRTYLTNGTTTKWLWTKWEMKGRRYCENIITKQHLWQDQMTLPQKVETGCANQADIVAFRSGHHAQMQQPAQMQQHAQMQQQQQYPHLASQQHPQQYAQQQPQHQTQHSGVNGAYRYPNTQFANMNLSSQAPAGYAQAGHHSSYAAATASNGQVSAHPSYATGASATVNGAHQVYQTASLGPQHANPSFVPQGGYNTQAQAGIHAAPRAQNAPWNHTPNQAPQYALPGQNGQREQYGQFGQQGQYSSAGTGSRFDWNGSHTGGNQHTNQHTNTPLPPQGFRSIPQASSAVPTNGHNAPTANEASTHQKRGKSRFWDRDLGADDTETKRSKTKDTRLGNGNFSHRLQNSITAKRAPDTNNFRSSKSTFRPKPAPLNADSVPHRRRFSKFRPVTNSGKAMLAASSKRIPDPSAVAAMHDRDFALSSSTKKSASAFDEDSFEGDPVVGQSQLVEKEFLRLTSAPRPADVRPPPILALALANVKAKWRTGVEDYDWACKQLKSIRQDYKVQHVDTPATLDAYETHARLALENGDLGEFNTCVAQAQSLYERVPRRAGVQDEFACYRILYNTLVSASDGVHAALLARMRARDRVHPATSFALAARAAIVGGNYHRFARMCARTPPRTMAAFLLARIAPGVRARALAVCAQAYGPTTLPAAFVLEELAFGGGLEGVAAGEREDVPEETAAEMRLLKTHRESAAVQRAMAFLIGINAVFERKGADAPKGVDGIVLECKKTRQKGVELVGMAGLITHAGGARPRR